MRWLLRMLARTLVRRIAVLLVAALFACLGGRVFAADYTMCIPTAPVSTGGAYLCPDQGIAAAMAQSSAAYHVSRGACGLSAGRVSVGATNVDTSGRIVQVMIVAANTGGNCAAVRMAWPANESCQDRNKNKLADAAPWYSEPSTCISGCKVQGTPFSQSNGGVKVYGMRDRSYTGDICTPSKPGNEIGPLTNEKEDGNKSKSDECSALGSGQTACVKPNGDHCATSSTGKTFCWKPDQTGEQKSDPDAQTKEPIGKPVTPPPSTDPTKEYQRSEGHQSTVCVNNTCTTYNVTNFVKTGAGTAKNSSGDNSPDGSGNTSGNGTPGKGSGSGSGGKDGDPDSATDSGDCETAPTCKGDTLKCLHLKYTWKSQCNTTKDEITGSGDCSPGGVPVCIGKGCKAQEYASLLQQWRGRCAAEDDRAKLGRDAASGAADAGGDSESDAVSDLWKKGPGQDGQGLDRNKLTLGGGELFPSIDIMGTAWSPPAQLYSVLAMIRQLVIAAGALASMYILFKK